MTGEQRGKNGRFLKGHPGGPGRPPRAVESDYLAALSDAVPMRTWRKIIRKAVEDAENGDRYAREWLGNYVIGKPESGRLLELAAKEMVDLDPVECRASSLVVLKPMIDARIRHFLRNSGGAHSEPKTSTG